MTATLCNYEHDSNFKFMYLHAMDDAKINDMLKQKYTSPQIQNELMDYYVQAYFV